MIDRQTLELGILFGNSKLWNEIGEEEVFAVALSQEKIGYCTIVGRAGIHIGCIMYIGEEDFTAIENNIKPEIFIKTFERPKNRIISGVLQFCVHTNRVWLQI